MKFDLEKAKKHIQGLVKEHKIKLHHHKSRSWRIGRVPGRKDWHVTIRPVKSVYTYTDALFALGHVLGQWRSKPRLFQVAGAWKWAKENAAFWTPRMTHIMEKNLLNFWGWQVRHKTAVLPPPDHEFWKLLSPETTQAFKEYLDVKEVMEA